jgi:thiamine monophosphate synthase
MDNEFETEEPFIVTTADMLEIVAGGGNGSEYVDVSGLIETAAKELREKDNEIEQLRKLEARYWEFASKYDSLLIDVGRLREALDFIAEGIDVGRHDGLSEDGPAHDADTMFAVARKALKEKE